MLSIGTISGTPNGAARYYVSGDYYSKDGSEPSEWSGKGAAMLGLEGPVTREALACSLSGTLPDGHAPGWQRGHHRAGWDLTFSAPKGISIMATVGEDARLLDAHIHAVGKALAFMESYAHVRVRGADGKISHRHTGNIVAATFTEFFSRALEPDLHTHCPVANMTYDRTRGKWYALDSRAFYRMKKAGGQVYRNALAAGVRRMGYGLITNAETGLFDIRGVPETLKKLFSKRRADIEHYARKHGLTSAADYARATLLTRANKVKTDHPTILKELRVRSVNYLGRLVELRARAEARPRQNRKDITGTADNAAAHGIAHLLSREAVVEHGHIVEEALKVSLGQVTAGDVERALKRRAGPDAKKGGYLRADQPTGGAPLYHGRTTETALAWENRLAAHVLKVRNTVWPLANRKAVEHCLSEARLTDEQRHAAAFVLRSRDRAVIVAGVAGSGKSHLVRTVASAATGRNCIALAPTATAAVDLGKSAGIDANTLAGFLQTGGHSSDRNTLLFVDEASMATTRQVVRLLDIASARKARVVFLGDTRQFDAIEQGKPLALLRSMGLRGKFIGTSFRQKNASMQKLVKAARDGELNLVFSLLGDRVQEIEAERLAQVTAENWIKHPTRDMIQIAALDNASRIAANAIIRARLQEEGKIGNRNLPFDILSSKALTAAQLGEADYYKQDDILVFHLGHAPLSIKRGEHFRVLGATDGTVKLERLRGGKILAFKPNRTGKKGLTLYAQQRRELDIGDRIQWRHNLASDGRIKNGHEGTIKKIKGDRATIRFNHGPQKTLDLKNNPYWDHGYVLTTYKQQGKTTPVNWIIANTRKAGEITQKSLYVAITRAERSVTILTDDAERFKSAVHQNPGGKTSSHEGRGIRINLHQARSVRKLSTVERFFDNLPGRIRTPAVNLLDRIAEIRAREQEHSKSHDTDVEHAPKANEGKAVLVGRLPEIHRDLTHGPRER